MFLGDYADVLRAHIKSFGTTKHRLATVSQKNGAHAVHNPLAHYREAISVDEVLSARSIVEALTMPMCAPLTGGAAAATVCNNVGLRRPADAQRIWMRLPGRHRWLTTTARYCLSAVMDHVIDPAMGQAGLHGRSRERCQMCAELCCGNR